MVNFLRWAWGVLVRAVLRTLALALEEQLPPALELALMSVWVLGLVVCGGGSNRDSMEYSVFQNTNMAQVAPRIMDSPCTAALLTTGDGARRSRMVWSV